MSRELPDEDNVLVRAAQRGEPGAFDRLVEIHRPKAVAFAQRFVRDPELALDLTQDAFVKAFRSLGSFDPELPFPPWFFRIVRNHCLNWIDREKKVRTESIEALAEEHYVQFRSEDADPREQAQSAETREMLWRSIETLRPAWREIIIMFHFHNLSYEEISKALGVPIGTVMSRLFNARKALAEAVREIA